MTASDEAEDGHEPILRIAVAGFGSMGRNHVRNLAARHDVRIVAVADPEESARLEAAHQIADVATFADPHQMLASIAMDAIVVAIPTTLHSGVAIDAIERHVAVLVEKPIAPTVAEGRRMVEAAKANDVLLQVGHIERFNPAILALEQYKIRPLFIESHRLAQFNPRGSDVAVVLDLMIHDIDLILSLVKSRVVRVDANGVSVVSGSEDIANARLQFENGCVANVTASRISQNTMRKMRLFQNDAYISIDFSQGFSEVFRLVDEGDPNVKPTMMLGKIDQGSRKRIIVYERPEVKEVNSLKYELELFAKSIQDGTEPPVTGRDGLQALEVAQEILKMIAANTAQLLGAQQKMDM